ncbi:MAG: M14 family zinc carboxypeptidase, partial [Bacteroidota bacterium]
VFFLWYLIENYERNPEVKAIVDNNELYFIPCLNPDGYLYNETIAPNGGGLWRKNRRDGVGVDLNRNYSYLTPEGEEQWGTSGTNPDPGSETYPGTGPFSEPETRAVRYFVETHDFQIALNNHTHGELLLYPFGYARDTETPDDFLFSQISAAMVRTNGYDNIISADLYPASGDSDDFMYGMLTTAKGGARDPVFAMTPEIGYSFWPAQADIEGICREMLIHNLTAAQALSNFGLIRADVPQKVNTLSFFLPYTLTRYGFSEGTLTVRFTPVSSNIATTAFETPQTGLQQGGELFSTSLIQLAESIQEGDSIIFELGVDNGKFYVGDRYAIVFGEAINVFTEMADNLDAWTTDGDWGIALGVHHESSPNSSVTDSPAGRYANDAVNTLRLVDPIDLTDPRIVAADLQFWATWNIEDDYDQVQLEVSIDGGQSWTPQCGMYTEPGALTQLTPDEPVYDGRQTEWVQEHIPLTDYLGEEVLLRFELSSDSNLALDGFYFDALQVDILRGTATGTRQVLKEPVRLWPNPTQNELRVATELRNYDYQLLNPLGQQLLSATGLSGTHRIDLSSLPNGIYLLQIYHAGQQRTEKVVKE